MKTMMLKTKDRIFAKVAGLAGLDGEKLTQMRRALGFVAPHRRTVATILAIMPIIAALAPWNR